ncbi:MAG: PASTA domain-containing protein [Microthrixaceae bacterium]
MDRREHPIAAAVGLTALLAVFVVGLVGLGVAVREGDRRVDVVDVVVPSLQGVSEDAARRTLEEVGLLMELDESPNELVPDGIVFEQDPIEGARIEEGSAVRVGVSTGPAGAIVPDVVGQQVTEALGLLVASGLTGEVVEVPDEEVRVGEVLATEPSAGRRAGGEGTVVVEVSRGPALRTIPEIASRDVIDVVTELGRLRLRPGSITRVEDAEFPDGTVLSIEPASGTRVPRGSDVSLVVSGTPEPVIIPAVTGLLRATADEVLDGVPLDFVFRVVALPAGDPRDGRVVRQGVPSMSEVPRGTAVEILVGSAPPPPTTVPPVTTTTTVP